MPFVAVTSDTPLRFRTAPTMINGTYGYEPVLPNFIRLIFFDDNNYYFLESSSDVVIISVNKSNIVELEYFGGLP
jgi:hypothetical protein